MILEGKTPMRLSNSVRYSHWRVLAALALSTLSILCVQPVVAADIQNPIETDFIQSAAGYAETFGTTRQVSNRSPQRYEMGRSRSRPAAANRRSGGGKGRYGKRSPFRGYALFAGFGEGYIGLDGTSLSIDSALDDDLNPRGVRLRLGKPIDDVFDVELHLGGGRDSVTPAADRFSATYLGAFLKGHVPLGDRSAVYGLAGFSGVGISQRIGDTEFSDSRGGFSFGFGLETRLSNRIDLTGDFVRYVGEEGEFAAVSAVNLGIKLYF